MRVADPLQPIPGMYIVEVRVENTRIRQKLLVQ
ncbi:MAG: hypothetical protein DRJ15_13305 [Bacteroidetes bacterium]|nr:MAG: hypothetical protein DRJ15_13305 [Bacteroidota bacterium]